MNYHNDWKLHMLQIKNKNILLLVPKFYGYEEKIRKHLENFGAKVCLLYDNLHTLNFVYRIICSKYNLLRDYMLLLYMMYNIKPKKKFDYIVVIKGESINKKIISILKEKYSDAKFIMYQWDSVDNNQNAIIISKFFDRILTFDIADSKKYNWEYLPLFYDNNNFQYQTKKYDLTFIASMHSQRNNILKKAKEITTKHHMKFFYHMYQSKSYCFWAKFIWRLPEWQKMDYADINFKSISIDAANDIYLKSKIIIDYSHPKQTGFTMRTIEAIGAKCKLLTNNQYIKDSDFFNENNIYIYEPENFNIPESFIAKPYVEYSQKIYHKYSLDGWLEVIFAE